ncbi:MAG: glycosyltransferase family 4 protein [Deltaproteobacteria bacterium]|nr:glycosyltransferase family 4 protein [Deltaproteobacteria bacterium]MBW2661163.1 glycosyltransferase family 4 protein [Deltaproteobacteria bacterium]
MKILYIVNIFADETNPDKEPFVRAQIESISSAGHEVDIFNINGELSKLNYLKALPRVIRIVKNKNYDMVHGHYVYSGWVAAFQRRYASVVSFMGSDLSGSFKKNGRISIQGKMDIYLSKILQLVVDGIIVKSLEMKDTLSEAQKQKAIVLPNGVDLDLFKDRSMKQARLTLNLDFKKKYVLFAGKYNIPQKGFHIVEQAVRKLKIIDPRYELLWVHRVPHSEVPLYMNAANVLALPSIKEGSPNVIKEALACNLPLVATNVGDVKDLVNGVHGCRIAERTPEAFAAAIHEIVSQGEKSNGRKAVEHLSIERVGQRLVTFYKQLI